LQNQADGEGGKNEPSHFASSPSTKKKENTPLVFSNPLPFPSKTHIEKHQVDFFQPDGSTISNIISEGPSHDLNMTYAFEWLHPDVPADDAAKIEELRQKYYGIAQMAVEKSIECLRRLAGEGKLGAA